ncbi:Nop52-domain-containing protein [Rozella allomycis CSF55]|uniref:Nop52-domain-containing protein n=1 Tax=Rozella allomycis (strain CSF55) TaxID=988480 RepID=A0A075AQW5_ROZAC|nr:Nucleolar, Nop52 domain-containing protein [Rozella allomycis CSF55]RKP21908.1 Nop52-domain-containing protein [Rozella allomycis CSF55]|eukprot:EPZ30982.1 Nucleolar, Nop52 domain-containing protein [Rozella allomycis CSF55]
MVEHEYNVTEQQVQFGKLLAHTDKKIRDQSFRKFSSTISQQMDMTELECMKVWKGLYYCKILFSTSSGYWMSDKPLVQQELASKFAKFFLNAKQWDLHLKCFWDTMMREWPGIDKWRLNKYYNLFREVLQASILLLKNNNWDLVQVEKWKMIMKEGPLSIKSDRDSIKLHIISKFLGCLRRSTDSVPSNVITALLTPIMELIEQSEKKNVFEKIKDYFIDPLLNGAVEDYVFEGEENDGNLGSIIEKDWFVSNLLQISASASIHSKMKKIIAESLKLHNIELPQNLSSILPKEKKYIFEVEKPKPKTKRKQRKIKLNSEKSERPAKKKVRLSLQEQGASTQSNSSQNPPKGILKKTDYTAPKIKLIDRNLKEKIKRLKKLKMAKQ